MFKFLVNSLNSSVLSGPIISATFPFTKSYALYDESINPTTPPTIPLATVLKNSNAGCSLVVNCNKEGIIGIILSTANPSNP